MKHREQLIAVSDDFLVGERGSADLGRRRGIGRFTGRPVRVVPAGLSGLGRRDFGAARGSFRRGRCNLGRRHGGHRLELGCVIIEGAEVPGWLTLLVASERGSGSRPQSSPAVRAAVGSVLSKRRDKPVGPSSPAMLRARRCSRF